MKNETADDRLRSIWLKPSRIGSGIARRNEPPDVRKHPLFCLVVSVNCDILPPWVILSCHYC